MRNRRFDFFDAPDDRQEGKVTHAQKHIISSLPLGLFANKPTLRDVEEMTHDLRRSFRSLVTAPISDTSLDAASRPIRSQGHRAAHAGRRGVRRLVPGLPRL